MADMSPAAGTAPQTPIEFTGRIVCGPPVRSDHNQTVAVWIGAGAYAGLVAIMDARPVEGECALDVRGIIFAGGPMPVPYVPN